MRKLLFTICTFLSAVSLMLAQGIQGNVTIGGSVSIVTTGHSVILSWNSSPGATTYNVYRGTASGGPYTRVASGLLSTTYTDVQVTQNQTLYYVTTAVSGSYESSYSNQVVAVIP
jgi:fibronectin type 3 domain-containing protein